MINRRSFCRGAAVSAVVLAAPASFVRAQTGGLIGGLGTDQSGALIDLMLAAEANGGDAIPIPYGDFLMSQPIFGKQNVLLRGALSEATRLWFDTITSGFAFDLTGPGTGTPPADRRFSGLDRMSIFGNGLPSGSSVGAIRIGRNHRTIDLLRDLNIGYFPNDGVLWDFDNWIVQALNLTIYNCATGSTGTTDGDSVVRSPAGFRKRPTVTDINDVLISHLKVETCGRPTATSGGWYTDLCRGINWSSSTLATNRGVLWSKCTAEGNYGIVEWLTQNVRGQIFDGPYIESRAGVKVGMEFDYVDTEIRSPQINGSAAAGGLNASDKAMKLYGDKITTITNYQRGSNWTTNELELHDTSRAVLIGSDPALRITKADAGTSYSLI